MNMIRLWTVLAAVGLLASCQTPGTSAGDVSGKHPDETQGAAAGAAAPEPAADAVRQTPKAPPARSEIVLLPAPKQLTWREGVCLVRNVPARAFIKRRLPSSEHAFYEALREVLVFESGMGAPEIGFRVDAAQVPHPQGYILDIAPGRITLVYQTQQGAYLGAMTLRQLARQYAQTGMLPCLRIEDAPDFNHRGVMIDISRDKVPTMDTLFLLVDHLAEWKVNQLQLYTEHTFAYPGHEVVWRDASPMTAADIRQLDIYCRERHIDLVPNQNSFGHMHRWLKHEAYAHLGETRGGRDLCPVSEESIAFLDGLYADLLPHFSSSYFNVGCDETYTLGRGCSEEAVRRKGKGRVYLDFLKQIHQLVRSYGRTMMFWGDIIMKHPSLIPELPREGLAALEWGYEAGHPFDAHGRRFAASGIPFHVAPGTSAWNSLLGRTSNALANLDNAARNGRKHGAEGFLITDWGDNGHWQTLPVSFLPMAKGAALAWNYEANKELPLASALNTHVFLDASGKMGQLAHEFGMVHQKTGVVLGNSTVYYQLLIHRLQGSPKAGPLAPMTLDSLNQARNALDALTAELKTVDMRRMDADWIVREYLLNARMARFALDLGSARLRAGGVATRSLPEAEAKPLRDALDGIIQEFQAVWLLRNRPGGLKDSIARLEEIRQALLP